MAIAIKDFSGVAPAQTRWKLPLGMAQVATNVNLESRTVKPWRTPVVVSSGYVSAATTTIFRFGRNLVSDVSYWFVWNKDVDVVKGPIIGDTTERTFYTGDGAPKWTNSTLALTGGPPYPQAYRTLGVARPTTAPVMSVTGTAASNDYVIQAYAYTNVTAYGEESAPSPICNGQKVYSGQTASLTGFEAAPTGTGSTVARRLYRAETSSTDTQLYFVKEAPIATTTVVDDVGSDIGEVLQTTSWDAPPSTLFGLLAMANGILVGFDGSDVCVSAQYAPYAWPKAWKSSADWPIVGGCSMGNQALVLTMGNPYMLEGSTPDALNLRKLDKPEACVSKRSIVNLSSPMPSMAGSSVMVGAVYYASQNGLCACDASGNVTVVTEGLLNRDDWQALTPTSIKGYAYNGRYFGFFNTGSTSGGFCFDPRGGTEALTLFPFYATGGFMDIVQDHLYLHVGTNIMLWNPDGGAPMTATWRSGVIQTSMIHWEVMQLLGYGLSASPATLNLYGDDELVASILVDDTKPFKFDCPDKCDQWEIEIITQAEVYGVVVAESFADFRAVT